MKIKEKHGRKEILVKGAPKDKAYFIPSDHTILVKEGDKIKAKAVLSEREPELTADFGGKVTINTNENRAEAAKTAERVASWLASKITNENADIADQANLFGTKDKEEAQAAAGNKAPRE